MHLVRLMRMGKEILETGKVIVRRPVEKDIDAIYKAGSSPLPKSPDRNQLDKWCIDMVEEAHR